MGSREKFRKKNLVGKSLGSKIRFLRINAFLLIRIFAELKKIKSNEIFAQIFA